MCQRNRFITVLSAVLTHAIFMVTCMGSLHAVKIAVAELACSYGYGCVLVIIYSVIWGMGIIYSSETSGEWDVHRAYALEGSFRKYWCVSLCNFYTLIYFSKFSSDSPLFEAQYCIMGSDTSVSLTRNAILIPLLLKLIKKNLEERFFI